jgi:hypothetical protein
MIAAETDVTARIARSLPRAAALVAVLSVAGAASAPSPASAGPKDQARPEPAVLPDAAATIPPYVIKGAAIELTMNGAMLRVEALDESRREAWFRLRSTLGGDPLPKRADWPEGFTVFEVSFANYSGGTLTFNPTVASCWRTNDHDLRPVHLDLVLEMLRALRGADVFDQAPLLREALRTFHLETLVLAHGQRASRLLLYRGAPSDARWLRLDFVDVEVGPHVIHPRFQFTVVQPARQ